MAEAPPNICLVVSFYLEADSLFLYLGSDGPVTILTKPDILRLTLLDTEAGPEAFITSILTSIADYRIARYSIGDVGSLGVVPGS